MPVSFHVSVDNISGCAVSVRFNGSHEVPVILVLKLDEPALHIQQLILGLGQSLNTLLDKPLHMSTKCAYINIMLSYYPLVLKWSCSDAQGVMNVACMSVQGKCRSRADPVLCKTMQQPEITLLYSCIGGPLT